MDHTPQGDDGGIRSLEFDAHKYLGEFRALLMDPEFGLHTRGKRRADHQARAQEMARLSVALARGKRRELEEVLRELEIPAPGSLAPLVERSFSQAVEALSALSDKYKNGERSLAGLAPPQQRAVIEALWGSFLHLGRVLPKVLNSTPLAALYETAEDVRSLIARHPDIDPKVVKYFAVRNHKDTEFAIDRYRVAVKNLRTRFPKIDPRVIGRYAISYPKDPVASAEQAVRRLRERRSDITKTVAEQVILNFGNQPSTDAIRRIQRNPRPQVVAA